jgi:hypothetical protein
MIAGSPASLATTRAKPNTPAAAPVGVAGTLTTEEGGGTEALTPAGPGIMIGESDASVAEQTPGTTAPDADAALGGDAGPATTAPADAGPPATAPATGGAPTAPATAPTAPATPTPAPAALVMNSRTDMHAPDGTPDTRTTVAMGEVVFFDVGGAAADWTASAGFPGRRTGRTTLAWELPDPGSATITATLPTGESASINMKVIAPKDIRMRKISEDAPGASGTANAGMRLSPRFTPGSVNFGNVEWLEVPGPPSNLTGYFAAQVAAGTNLNHVPNPNFLRIAPGLNDHAAAFGFPPPFSAGTWDWSIPNRFRRAATTGAGTVFVTTLQSFRMDAAGAITVSKQGASVTKAPIP